MSYVLDTPFRSQLFVLNSNNADIYNNSTYLSDVVFLLNNRIIVPDNIAVLVSVQSANVPVSFYIVNEYNNYLHITRSDNTITAVTITQGNYTANDFLNYMNNLSNGYTWSFSTITNKFTITNSSYDFTIDSSSTCQDLIGIIGSTTSSSYSLTSSYVCNFSGTLYLTIETQLTTHNIDSYDGSFSHELMAIPLNESAGGVVLYENKNNYKSYLNDKYISYLEVKIYDDNKNLINFNGKNWFILLQFDYINSLSYSGLPPSIGDIPVASYNPSNPLPPDADPNENNEVLQPTNTLANFSDFDDPTTKDDFILEHLEKQ